MIGVKNSPVWGQKERICLDGVCGRAFSRVRAGVISHYANILHAESSKEGRLTTIRCLSRTEIYLVGINYMLFADKMGSV